MFDHLDDPRPFRVDDEFHRAVVGRGRRLRLRRRLAVTASGLAVMLGTVGVAGALYVDRRDAAIDRIDLQTVPGTDGATNILLVGSDARPPGADDGVEGSRADTIAVLRLHEDGSIGVLGIPRDLWDTTNGRKINAYGGDPQVLVDAINRITGLPIDHYVELDFEGFVQLVDDLGGIELAVDGPVRDETTGLDLQPTPCATLDGETALALVRSRRVEGDTSGDFGRMARGHAALSAAVVALADAGAGPAEIDRYSRVLADHARLDQGLSLGRIAEIGRTVAAAGPSGVQSTTLPVAEWQDPATGAMSLLLDPAAPEAAAVLQRFGASAGAPATSAPVDGVVNPFVTPPPVYAPLRPCV